MAAQKVEAEPFSLSTLDVLQGIKDFTLDNGLRVIVLPDKRSPVVTHAVAYAVGNADVPSGKSGLAHYVEHLMFKGTGEDPGISFSEKMNSVGGSYNAFTSQDYTVYYERVLKPHLGFVMELEADRMANLTIDSKDAKTELKVVLEERLQRVDSNPRAQLYEAMNYVIFGVSPYRFSVLGTQNDLENLDASDARAFYEEWYSPENATVLVFGDVSYVEVKRLAEKIYGKIAKRAGKSSDKRTRSKESPSFASERLVGVDTKDLSASSIVMSWLVPSLLSGEAGEAESITLLCNLIGGDRNSSRLYKRLVLEKKLATHTACQYSSTTIGDTVLSIVAVPTEKVSSEVLFEEIKLAISELRTDGISEKELYKAKHHVIGSFAHLQDSLVYRANLVGTAVAIGRSITDITTWPSKLHSVDLGSVTRVLNQYLIPERLVMGYLFEPGSSVSIEKNAGSLDNSNYASALGGTLDD